MFWGYISGRYGKGSGLFQEKEQRTITIKTYSEHTFPIIQNYIYTSRYSGLKFQQDGGPGYTTKYIIKHIANKGVVPIFWPLFSLDLLPIKTLQNRIKDILSVLDPKVYRDYQRLRTAILEVQDIITDAEVRDLIYGIGVHCIAIKNAYGIYIEF